ncbi:MAG TPA: biotin/lipoyl-binding protein [Bacteroidetes bacterium]|nr:biotin/lipoyl-binding protein [Bacteroidota bacterium]
MNDTFDLTVNGKFEYSLSAGDLDKLDIIELGDHSFHLMDKGKSIRAEIIGLDREQKSVKLKVGTEYYEIDIADKYDRLVKEMGLNTNVVHKINEIKAPMPGLVLSIEIAPGTEVETGDALLVLEAMKMENIIKSPGEGTVKSIFVKTGQAVDKGEVLIEME